MAARYLTFYRKFAKKIKTSISEGEHFRGMKKGMFIIFVTFCLFFMATLADGADWQYYGLDKDGDSLFYDKENVTHSNDIVKIYQKETYLADNLFWIKQRLGDKYSDLKEVVNLIEIDCSAKRSKIRTVTYYNTKENVIESRDQAGTDWILMPQKSELHMLYELCCPAEWAYVTSSKDDDYFLNISKMTVNHSDVTFWMKGINRKTSQEAEKDKFTIKCKSGTYALRHHIKYQSDGSASKVTSYDRYIEWSRISPDTIIGFFQKLLCTDGLARKDIKDQLHNISKK